MILKDNIQGLQHAGIPVTNLDRSIVFYAKLGFMEVMRTDLPGASDVIRVAMMRYKGFTLELFQLGKEEREAASKRTDGHIDHLALDVMDIEQALIEIRAAGLEVVEKDAPVYLPFWDHGVKYFTIRGTDGEKIEFNQLLR